MDEILFAWLEATDLAALDVVKTAGATTKAEEGRRLLLMVAAAMGLPYAFAAHFAPAQFEIAVKIYKQNFQPSAFLSKPYAMACVNMIGADTDKEAAFLATSIYQMFLGIITNHRRPLQPPVENMDDVWDAPARAAVEQMTRYTFLGNKETLRKKINAFIEANGIDELMVTSNVYDSEARLKSFSVLIEAIGK